MAVNSLQNSTAIRLMGMVSGMDTDTIIQQTLRLHQLKIDSRFRSRTLLEWKQQSLNSIADDITAFRRSFLTTMGANAMRISSTYNSNVATITGKNAGAISISTTTSSPVGTLRIGQIASLAKATTVSTVGRVSRDGAGFKLTDKLGGMKVSNREIVFDSMGNADVNINGTDYVLNRNDNINDINRKIAQKGGNQIIFYDGNVDYLGRKFAKINLNGKETVVYKDEAYEYQNNVGGKTAVTNALLFGSGNFNDYTITDAGGNVLGSGTGSGSLGQLDTVRDMLENAGIDVENDLTWTEMNNNPGSPKYAMVQINGQEVYIHDWQLDQNVAESSQTSALREAVIFGTSNYVNVTVNGTAVNVTRYATAEDINNNLTSLGATGSHILFDQGASEPKYAEFEINGVSGVRVFQDEIAKGGFTTAMTARANSGDSGGLSFDADGKAYITVGNGATNATIQLDKDMTIQDMLDAVNSTGLGITMKYNQLADQFTLESNRAGASTIFAGGMQAFGIYNGSYDNGTVARVQINGSWVESRTNTIEFSGFKLTLNETTHGSGAIGANGVPAWTDADDITVTIKRDATEPLEKIKSFIEAYNVLIKKLEDLIAERKTTSEATYKPLTDEEKSLMSDKQVEDWEKIAKKSLLRNDSALQNLTQDLRSALFAKVTAAGLSPSQIGLSTGRWDENLGGQIVLDETKLRAALEEDPDRVAELFMGGADSTNYADRGLLWRIDDLMYNYTYKSQTTSLSNLENSIKKTNEQMEKLRMKMFDEEEKMYKKFSAMETALSKIQSQADWFTAMLNSTSNSK